MAFLFLVLKASLIQFPGHKNIKLNFFGINKPCSHFTDMGTVHCLLDQTLGGDDLRAGLNGSRSDVDAQTSPLTSASIMGPSVEEPLSMQPIEALELACVLGFGVYQPYRGKL